MYGKNFQIDGVHISSSFTHAPPHSKPAPNFLSSRPRQKEITHKICFPQQQKGVEETMICFIKIQSENMKMTWNIRFFIFCMICIFLKCDGFKVL